MSVGLDRDIDRSPYGGPVAEDVGVAGGFTTFGPFAVGQEIEAVEAYIMGSAATTLEFSLALCDRPPSTDSQFAANEQLVRDATNDPPRVSIGVLADVPIRLVLPVGRVIGPQRRFFCVRVGTGAGLLTGSLWMKFGGRWP